MKSSSRSIFAIASAIIFLFSCNESGDKSADSSTTGDSANQTTSPGSSDVANAGSTISTVPWNVLVIRMKVKNYAAWKMAYDARDSIRLANGLHNYVVGRGVNDTSMVMVALRADDMQKARAYAANPALKQAMQKGGVIGNAKFDYIVLTLRDSANISTDLRALTQFPVKSWSTWQAKFREGEQERLDNGITVRTIGHEASDTNKVRLVTAITDTAKAYAYWKSDMIKNRRAASGVIGEPERFVFRILQRY